MRKSEVGGSEGCQGLPPVTGKSFRFVRACARCPLPSGSEPQNGCSAFFPFPFWPREAFPFPFLGRAFPFSLEIESEIKVKSKWNQKWNQSEFKVKSMWNPSESTVTSKWIQSEISVKSTWNQREIKVKSKVKSKWISESKWSETPRPHPSPQSSYPASAGLMDIYIYIYIYIYICTYPLTYSPWALQHVP